MFDAGEGGQWVPHSSPAVSHRCIGVLDFFPHEVHHVRRCSLLDCGFQIHRGVFQDAEIRATPAQAKAPAEGTQCAGGHQRRRASTRLEGRKRSSEAKVARGATRSKFQCVIEEAETTGQVHCMLEVLGSTDIILTFNAGNQIKKRREPRTPQKACPSKCQHYKPSEL